MEEFKDSPTALVGDSDCTAGGKSLCEKHSIGGYPTIKWGDPNDMQDYKGGRSYDDLKKFAEESLGPSCGPGDNIELCDAETKASINKYMTMSAGKLEGRIRNFEKMVEFDVPIMKKVLAYQKTGGGGNAEL